jgi:hypothetical protein
VFDLDELESGALPSQLASSQVSDAPFRLAVPREEIWSATLSPDTVTDWVIAALSAHG